MFKQGKGFENVADRKFLRRTRRDQVQQIVMFLYHFIIIRKAPYRVSSEGQAKNVLVFTYCIYESFTHKEGVSGKVPINSKLETRNSKLVQWCGREESNFHGLA